MCASYGHDGLDFVPDFAKILVANVAESTIETFPYITTFCAKWGNDFRAYLSRAFWNLRKLGSRAVLGIWNVQFYAKACDILNLGRVGLRLLIGRWARASSKQTFVGWSTAGSYLPILALKCDFSSIADLHGLSLWLAHNRAYGYFGFIDISGNSELGRRLRRRATRRVKNDS